MNSLYPNQHWNATAKSECIKNAASDFGRKFGRGLNAAGIPVIQTQEKTEKKIKPDSKIMKHFKEAVDSGDEATVIMLSNLYEIKIEEPDVTENENTESRSGE